jgi:hypothetical protein
MEGGEGGSEYVMLLYVPLGPPPLKLMNIKLPMYLFFYMVLGLNDFDAGISSTRAIGRSGPWNLDFFSPTLPMALVNGCYPPPSKS